MGLPNFATVLNVTLIVVKSILRTIQNADEFS